MEAVNKLEKVEETKRFLNQLKQHEGFRNYVYTCPSGYPTIGYGHNLLVNPIDGIDRNSIITEPFATEILRQDVKKFAAQLDAKLSWWRQLSLPRQAVLLNMAFNMGIETLRGFHTTLGHISQGKYKLASETMLHSKWAGQVGGRAKQLSKQMATGEWQ